MNEVFIWLQNIFLVIITLSFFQILIPDSSMAKYLRYIFSLVILAMILEPMFVLLKIQA